MRIARALGLTGLLVLGGASSGWSGSRDADAPTVVFTSLGSGFGTQGLGGVASLNVGRGPLVYVLRASTTTEFEIFGPSPDQSDTDYSVLVGKRSGHGRTFSSIAAGIGLVRSVRRGALLAPPGWFFGGAYERLDRVTVGLPLDFKATANLPGIGIGVNVFANLNTRASFVGVALTVQLGKLR